MPTMNVRENIRTAGFAVLLLQASLAHARFTRLFGVPITPKDNTAECNVDVQKELGLIDHKKWGSLRFDCSGGYIKSLYLSPDSQIGKSIIRFANEHWKLFDSEHISLVEDGTPWPKIVRTRFGIGFHSRDLDKGIRPLAGGGTILFYDFGSVMAEPQPGFDISPKTTGEAAKIKALQYTEKNRGHLPNKVKSVELIIRDYCVSNANPPPKPYLVWWVRIKEAKNSNLVSCFVDATTGELCGLNGPCYSVSDSFEM